MGKIVKNGSMLRNPGNKNPQRLRHRWNPSKYFDVMNVVSRWHVEGIVHTVNEDRTEYSSASVTLTESAQFNEWQTARGTIPLPGEGPNRGKGGNKPKASNSNNNGGSMQQHVEGGDLFGQLATVLQKISESNARIPDGLSDRLEAIESTVERLEKSAPQRIEVSVNGVVNEVKGVAHRRFKILCELVANRENAYLWGPPGTGKTVAAKMAADAAGLSFAYSSRVLEHYSLRGYTTSDGKLVDTEFHKAFRDGGVFLLDELDRSDPNAALWLNAALANGYADFPTGVVKRHPDFVCIATGNTNMSGAADGFAAEKQDSSVADRYAFLHWPIDESMEEKIFHGFGLESDKWLRYVRAARAEVERRQIADFYITPRATYEGAKALASGRSWNLVVEQYVQRNCDVTTWKAVHTIATEAIKGGE